MLGWGRRGVERGDYPVCVPFVTIVLIISFQAANWINQARREWDGNGDETRLSQKPREKIALFEAAPYEWNFGSKHQEFFSFGSNKVLCEQVSDLKLTNPFRADCTTFRVRGPMLWDCIHPSMSFLKRLSFLFILRVSQKSVMQLQSQANNLAELAPSLESFSSSSVRMQT